MGTYLKANMAGHNIDVEYHKWKQYIKNASKLPYTK